ncbi:hypothetical protein JOM56_011881 [Amanita muscaria]
MIATAIKQFTTYHGELVQAMPKSGASVAIPTGNTKTLATMSRSEAANLQDAVVSIPSLQCVCGQTREQHVQMPEFQPEPICNATIAGSHPALAYSTAASGAFQLWVPSPPSTGTVQQQRVASSSRQRSTPNRRQSRYNQLADTGSPAVGTAPTPLAGGTAVVFTVAIWPFVQSSITSYPSYPPPSLEYQPRDLGSIVETLAAANLTFGLTFAEDVQPPWRIINQQLHMHLERHGLQMPLKPMDDGTNFNRLSWDLVTSGKEKKGGVVPLKSNQVYSSRFTMEYLREMAIGHPEHMGALMLVLGKIFQSVATPFSEKQAVPLKGNLLGPIAPMGPQHACFPWRLMAKHEFVKLSLPRGGDRDACIPGQCPPEVHCQRLPPLIPVIPARRIRSPSPLPMTRNTRARVTASEDSVPEVAKLTRAQLTGWQARVREGHRMADYTIQAPSEHLPQAFIHLLKALMTGTAPRAYRPESPLVFCTIREKVALLTAIISPFRTGRSVNAGMGLGPARSTYHGALQARVTSGNRWNIMGDGTYYTLNLSTDSQLVSSSSLMEYQLDGALAALSIVHLVVEPCPISPFLIYTACFTGATCLLKSQQHLLALVPDRQTRSVVSAILNFKRTDIITPEAVVMHEVASRALEVALVEIDYFQEAREDEPHQKLLLQLLSLTLLGHTDPWSHCRFQAFSEGLRLKFLGVNQFLQQFVKPDEQTDPPIYDFQWQFLSAIYNRRINKASEVIDRLNITGTHNQDDSGPIFFNLFALRLRRWLSGLGHPPELVGSTVTESEYQSSLQVQGAFRPRLFWRAISDFEVLPVVSLTHAYMRFKFVPELEPNGSRLYITVRTCTLDMEVVIDAHIANLLLEPGCLDDTESTGFDLWWHPQMLSMAGDYNTY